MTEPNYAKSIAWMKARGRQGELDSRVDPKERYKFWTDDQGREMVTPKFDMRVEAWEKVCIRFGYILQLLPDDKLTPYERAIRDALAQGRSDAILYGPPGTGKTTVALLALRELYFAGRSVRATRFSTFKTQMEPRYCDAHEITPEDVLGGYHEPQFLLIDELGYGESRKATTEHERRVLFDLISPRHGLNRRTWLLSNIPRDDLYELYGEAALSRLDTVGRCVVADFTGRENFRLQPQDGAEDERTDGGQDPR